MNMNPLACCMHCGCPADVHGSKDALCLCCRGATVRCSRCHEWLTAGDWPWCKGKPEDHKNPHYGWHFASK